MCTGLQRTIHPRLANSSPVQLIHGEKSHGVRVGPFETCCITITATHTFGTCGIKFLVLRYYYIICPAAYHEVGGRLNILNSTAPNSIKTHPVPSPYDVYRIVLASVAAEAAIEILNSGAHRLAARFSFVGWLAFSGWERHGGCPR